MSARHFNAAAMPEVERLRDAMRDARVAVRPVKVDTRTHYAPFLGGHRLSRLFPAQVEALDHASTLQSRLDALRGQRERPCMCCRKPFLSAGRHNRLCDYCRTHVNDAGMW